MKILFVNACVRGKSRSRSYSIAETFLKELKLQSNEVEIAEVDLMKINPPYLTY